MIRFRTATTARWKIGSIGEYKDAQDLVANRYWDITELAINDHPIPVLTDMVDIDDDEDVVSTELLFEAQLEHEQMEQEMLEDALADIASSLDEDTWLKQLNFIKVTK